LHESGDFAGFIVIAADIAIDLTMVSRHHMESVVG
jgi:hypothetical protein